MKKKIYLIAFTVLGILLQFIIHAWVETWYIDLLVNDFSEYGFGLTWNQWYLIHHIATVVLLIGGALFGFWQGRFWWKKIYQKK